MRAPWNSRYSRRNPFGGAFDEGGPVGSNIAPQNAQPWSGSQSGGSGLKGSGYGLGKGSNVSQNTNINPNAVGYNPNEYWNVPTGYFTNPPPPPQYSPPPSYTPTQSLFQSQKTFNAAPAPQRPSAPEPWYEPGPQPYWQPNPDGSVTFFTDSTYSTPIRNPWDASTPYNTPRGSGGPGWHPPDTQTLPSGQFMTSGPYGPFSIP